MALDAGYEVGSGSDFDPAAGLFAEVSAGWRWSVGGTPVGGGVRVGVTPTLTRSNAVDEGCQATVDGLGWFRLEGWLLAGVEMAPSLGGRVRMRVGVDGGLQRERESRACTADLHFVGGELHVAAGPEIVFGPLALRPQAGLGIGFPYAEVSAGVSLGVVWTP